ncbi:hypothetical protein [Aureivirga sp. CE67]|uniref:hypothetical protein n=1 Tax=Aureivirga sp. CE67 TaxID=1788983 RepID=UPI0018CA14D5|nr:hypothetical protein [Aureivirga sp. CE67]
MVDFKFPKSVTFYLKNFSDDWLKKHPIILKLKTFAKNEIEEGRWGGEDHFFDLIIIDKKTTTLDNEYFKTYNEIYRRLSAMERRPIELHYSLVEIELTSEIELENWITYLEKRKTFPYENLLGKKEELIQKIQNSGNSQIHYFPYLQRKRDLWNDENAEKKYELNYSLK